MSIKRGFWLLIALQVFNSAWLCADVIKVIDDEGMQYQFDRPLKRIISLSPHATELLFAAGASSQVVGAVSFSDYPEAAKKIPRVGSYKKIDLEMVLEMKPDLIIGWKGGGALQQDEKLHQLGLPVYYSEPRTFEEVASNIIKMGKMLGTNSIAEKNAADFLKELENLRHTYSDRQQVEVFYQVWNQPLMTINKDHLITQIIEFCGGHNVFADLSARAPRVDIESVIAKNPQAIIIGYSERRNNWPEEWKKWPMIKAVKNNHVFTVNADFIVRQGPRVVKGIRKVCEKLDVVRNFYKK